jgi:Na+/proline symporter
MSSAAAPAQSETPRRHSRRKTQARTQLIGVLLVMVAAFALMFSFAFNHEYNRWRVLIGLLFGAGVTCALLFVAVWKRQNWARYVLIVALIGLMATFGLCLIFLLSDPTETSSPAIPILGYSLGLLTLDAGWLMFSKRIRYLTTPPGSGG